MIVSKPEQTETAPGSAAEMNGDDAVVLSRRGNRTDFDWCGSMAQAIRRRRERIDSGEYERVCVRRVRRLGSRRSGTRHWLYVGCPVMEWRMTPSEFGTSSTEDRGLPLCNC